MNYFFNLCGRFIYRDIGYSFVLNSIKGLKLYKYVFFDSIIKFKFKIEIV